MKGLFLTLILFSNIALAQNSKLYDLKRRLIADRSYTIDRTSFENVKSIEKVLLPLIYNTIKYPAEARENGVQGIVIVQLSINRKTQSYNYKIVKSDSEELRKPVIDFFGVLSELIINDMCPEDKAIMVYIPIKFFIVKNSFKNSLNKNHSITISTNDIAPETIVNQ